MASGDLTSRRVKRALFFIPALAILGALSWPAGYGRPGPTPAVADTCLDPLNVICVPTSPTSSPSPTPHASPTPSHSPSPHPTATHSQPPSTSPTTPSAPSTDNSGGAIGAASGPPAPPTVQPTSIAMTSEPADPQPGPVANLIITVSGQNGADRYGVSGLRLPVLHKPQPRPHHPPLATHPIPPASGPP